MAAKTHLFNCLSDNFGVLIHDPATGATASIDAPEAAAVETALQTTGWKLTDILVTHHHHDHTDGVAPLKQKYGCRVVGPNSDKFRAVDETVGEGGSVKVGNLTARVLETPGHTLDHICYIFDNDKIAFVADTLFSVGCGRVVEGTMEQMWHSLLNMRALQDVMFFLCFNFYL
jgi:hydroxyacylglutathione hydrolase